MDTEFDIQNYELTFPDWTQTWIDRTRVCQELYCLHCAHPYNSIPIPLPTKRRLDVYECTGLFCSFNCAKSHSLIMGGYDVGSRATWLTSLLRHMFHHTCVIQNDPDSGTCLYDWKDGIKCAPPRQQLQTFGGRMTIEEYRRNFVVAQRLEGPLLNKDFITEANTAKWIINIPEQIVEKTLILPEDFEIQERLIHLKCSQPAMTQQQTQVARKRKKIDEIKNNVHRQTKETIYQQTRDNKRSRLSALMNGLNIKITNHETV